MKHKTQPVSRIDHDITKALADGHLEMVGEDAFRLTKAGKQEAEDLLLVSADSLEIFMQLTLAHLHISNADKQAIQGVFEKALAQSRFKDGVIQQLLAERAA